MMTIQYTQTPIPLSQNEFQQIDYQVMAQAFALHTDRGNLWDECDYRQQLVLMCTSIGLEALEEVCMSISHNGFSKNYFIDLLINGNIYELKSTSAISKQHESQTLNYLFMANTRHGKIINFRPEPLTWRFISTSLQTENRAQYFIQDQGWNPQDQSAKTIPSILKGILSDWGAYLSIHLYKQALCHFLTIPLEHEHQRFIHVSPETTLHISGLREQKNNLKNNLQKYLNISNYNELLWMNFDQNHIELSTLNHSA